MKYVVGICLLVIISLILIFYLKKQSVDTNNNVLIMVPGLSDNNVFNPILIWWWKQQGFKMIIFQPKWKESEDYQTKLNRLLNLIDEESKNNLVSLIGTSAGGSLVINAFNKRPDKINKVITVCSRLKKGEEFDTKDYPSFGESVLESEKNINQFSTKDKEKIMTIRSKFFDELVPNNTSIIDGAKNITVPTGGHLFSILSSLSWYSKPLVEFIKTDF